MGRVSFFILLFSLVSASATGEPATRVYLNGVPTPVFFNDGDSFRVLSGPLKGTKARLSGFNTLESYGPVHQWGDWHSKELYILAKEATLNARRGVWHCTSNMERDTYQRILWFCPDLATDQVKRGLAHAMTVDANAADSRVLAAQHEAIKDHRGIWAHGVPAYVLTSLHSISEGGGYKGKTYNRLVSTRDGHSAKWLHNDSYDECSQICSREIKVEPEVSATVAELLRSDPSAGPIVKAMSDEQVQRIVTDFAQLGHFVGVEDPGQEQTLSSVLEGYRTSGELPQGEPQKGSCVVYVEFERRYGRAKPDCLK